jgi:hypothetical protein
MFNRKCKPFTPCDVNNFNPVLLRDVTVGALHDLRIGPASDRAGADAKLLGQGSVALKLRQDRGCGLLVHQVAVLFVAHLFSNIIQQATV